MAFGRLRKSPDVQPRRRVASGPPASQPAFSYHAKRSTRTADVVQQGRVLKTNTENESEKSRIRVRRRFFSAGLVVILGVLIWALSVSTVAKIYIVQPDGFSYLPHSISDYQSAAAQAIGSSLYNRLKLTISSSDIANQIEKRYPEVSHAAVTVTLIGNTPRVYLQLAQPALIYSSTSGSYVLKGNGVIIANSALIPKSELPQLATVLSSANSSLKAGDQVLTSSDVDFIRTVKAALADKRVGVSKMVLVPMAEELDVYPAGVSYFVKFNLSETDALQQVGTYLATIATLNQQHQTPSQYVDVRVDGRAYYK